MGDGSTEHTSLGYWARPLPVAQKSDTINPQEIFIWLNRMSPRESLSISERSWPPAAGSPIGSD